MRSNDVVRLGAVCVLAAGPVAGQNLNLDLSFGGMVNGEELSATGMGQLSTDGDAASSASIVFDSLPSSFTPLATSMMSNLCTLAFSTGGGTDNLFDITGGSYSMTRVFQYPTLGPSSNLVVSAEVTLDGDTLVSEMTFDGNYAGPIDLVSISSYAVTWLPSSTEGEFFEAGTIIAETGGEGFSEPLIISFASVFTGFEGSLEQPQLGTADFETSFDGQSLDISWNGEFERSVPAPATLALLGGLIAARRRRG